VPEVIERALAGLVGVDQWLIERGLVGALYDSGVRYRWELPGTGWDHAAILGARGTGDCKDLTAWRCAELQLAGVDAQPLIVRTGQRNYHALVRFPDGSTEDPSIILGARRGSRS
jgi:hypothetical protein